MNNFKIESLLFDLDGTLVDTALDFIQVLNAQRMDYGLATLPDKVIRNTVSDGAKALTQLGFGGKEGDKDFEQKRSELLERYAQCVGDSASLFDGMEQVLNTLESHHIPWGIVTNKPKLYTDILLAKLKLDTRSAVTLCPDDVTKLKPDPESLVLAANILEVSVSNTIYVGDHVRDIQAGKAAQMKTVAVRYGYIGNQDEIVGWDADQIISHPSELIPLFITS